MLESNLGIFYMLLKSWTYMQLLNLEFELDS